MSQISKQGLSVDNGISFPNNNSGQITPANLRNFNTNMIDSLVDENTYQSFTASVTSSLTNLNAFTASQQPTFTALNSFTASQLTINTGVNSFTQSATGRLNNLESTTSSLNAWSSSINQILVNGTSIGTSTRFFFNGYVSASIVQNVNGPIASITILADQTFTPSASFNAYTASTNTFTASVKISIDNLNSTTASLNTSVAQLNAFTASLDATYATDAQLNYSASVLQANIDTKLNTSSFNSFSSSVATSFSSSEATFNAYTSSTNSTINSLKSNTGSYATTGSNTFTDSQFVNGNLQMNGQFASLNIGLNNENSGAQYPNATIRVDENTYHNDGIFGGYAVRNTTANGLDTLLIGIAGNSYSPYAPEVVGWIGGGGLNEAGNDTAILFRTGSSNMEVYKPTVFNYPITITGSVYNNIFSASIASSTASLDFSTSNMFTLTLPGTITTNINIQNVRPGQTAMLRIRNAGTAATASFSTNVYQPNSAYYVPTNISGSEDILTFSSFDSTKAYLVSVLNMTNN